jgi:hypothetical protein
VVEGRGVDQINSEKEVFTVVFIETT